MEKTLSFLWFINFIQSSLSTEVCREIEGVAITYCDEGFHCCENNRHCCSSASLGATAIVAIVIGGILFIAVIIVFYLLCRKHVPRKPTGCENPALELEELPPPYLLDDFKSSPLPSFYPVQPPPYEPEANAELKSLDNLTSQNVLNTNNDETSQAIKLVNNDVDQNALSPCISGTSQSPSHVNNDGEDRNVAWPSSTERAESHLEECGGSLSAKTAVYTEEIKSDHVRPDISESVCTVSVHVVATDETRNLEETV